MIKIYSYCKHCLCITAFMLFGIFSFIGKAQNASYVPNEILVKFTPNTTESEKNNLRLQILGLTSQELGSTSIEKWVFPSIININNTILNDIESVVDYYSTHPNIEFVEPNFLLSLNLTPNDPFFPQLWGLHNTGQTGGTPDADIDAPEAWDIKKESPNIKVGVIDTGIDWGHPDLVDNIWQNMGEDIDQDGQVIQWDGEKWIFDPDDENGIDDDGNGYVDDFVGWDFVNNDNNPYDDHAHGTHVAGTIGAEGNNQEGIVGVTWEVQMAALKFLSNRGRGSTSGAISAIDYATNMGFELTNNSWSGPSSSNALYQAIQRANNSGQLFVAAAGNNGKDVDNDPYPRYPAAYDLPNIISVAATNHYDNLAFFSNYGTTLVDLAAPGEGILSTIPGNSYASYNGTSMATPHVSGAIALIWSHCNALEYLEIKDRLLSTVDVLPSLAGKCVTEGRLNLFNALQSEQGTATFTYTNSGLNATFTPDYTNGTSYYWEFGDGNTSTEASPNYTYANAGSYMVSLRVENDCSSYYHTQIVELIPCQASFSVTSNSGANDHSICVGNTGTFTNTTSGAITSEWRINNVVVSNSPSFSRTFTQLGSNIITLYTTTSNNNCTVSQEVIIRGNARNLELGSDIYVCENSVIIDSELPDMAAYFWDLDEAPHAVGTPTLEVTQSGIYRLSVVDHCDQITTDVIKVVLDACDDVCPGDANADGICNNVDLLEYFKNHVGRTGPPRPDATCDWRPQPAPNWNIDNYDPDVKHCDFDGNGTVDASIDVSVLTKNYGKTDASKEPRLNNTDNISNEYRLYAERSHPQISGQDQNDVYGLSFLNTTNIPLDISGITFTIKYDNGQELIADETYSEMGQSGDNLLTFIQERPNNTIEGAVGRIDGTNLSHAPNSEIIVSEFIIVENIVTGEPDNTAATATDIIVSDIVITNKDGEQVRLAETTASNNPGPQEAGIASNNTEPLGVAMTASYAFDCANGSTATAIPYGGTPPYTYLWENGQTTVEASPFYPGAHRVTVTDATGEQREGRILVQGSVNCPNANSLPIELLSFTAHPNENKIILDWVTTNEVNVTNFIVQRSLDGETFTTINTVDAKGKNNTNTAYQIKDYNILPNQTYYYRIQTNEVDKSVLSKVVTARLEQVFTQFFTAQPNPTEDFVTLQLDAPQVQPIQVRIYNQLGQQVAIKNYPVANTTTLSLDLSDFSNGIYLVELTQGATQQSLKVVKQ